MRVQLPRRSDGVEFRAFHVGHAPKSHTVCSETPQCNGLLSLQLRANPNPLHKTETTRHQGTVNTNSTSRSTTSTDTVYSSGSGTCHGTSTKTTYEEKKYEHTTLFIKAFVHKVVEVDGKKDIDRLPLFTAQHKGQWRWSKPDKDAFVKAMEFIQKQLK